MEVYYGTWQVHSRWVNHFRHWGGLQKVRCHVCVGHGQTATPCILRGAAVQYNATHQVLTEILESPSVRYISLHDI